MKCSSYVPVYYHARDLKNLGASGFSWHLFDSNTNYGEERGYNISLPRSDINQCLAYDKSALWQIIQNHEATFRYQVEELHRVYKRQRELMGEMRAYDLISPTSKKSCNSLSQVTSHATSWLFGYNIQQTPIEVKFLPSTSTVDEKNSDFNLHISQPASSDSGDFSGINLNSTKKPCFIDLNEPVQSDSVINSSEPFDLNCTPVDCFSEPEISINEETTAVLDCTYSAYNHGMSNGKCVDDKFLKIDLNIEVVVDELSPLKSSGNTELVGPVSPENKECSPPRGKSEDVLLLSEQGIGEGQLSSVGPDIVAAQTLLSISSSIPEPLLMNSDNCCLFWFAEMVSSIGDDDDVEKERGISSRSGMGPTRRTRQRKDFEKAPLKRNAGKRARAKPIKRKKLCSQEDVVSKLAVVKDWGMIRKRQEGYRRRASKFVVLRP